MIAPTKSVRTKDGHEVILWNRPFGPMKSIIGVLIDNGKEELAIWDFNGKYAGIPGDNPLDLENIPEELKRSN